jgi:hypothetical protein
VPEAASFRFDLRPSRGESAARGLALGLTAAAAAACLAAAFVDASSLRLVAAAVASAAVVFALCPGRGGRTDRIRLDGEARLAVVRGETEQAAEVAYCSPHYLCLDAGGRRVPVFADAVAPDAWRRLLVASRWTRRPAAADDGAAARTK